MIRFETIRDRVRAYHPGADFDLLRRAYVVAAQAHRGQVRRSGEPYLTHPLEVAGILADLQLDPISVACGLLHDVVEDTAVGSEDLERLFGRDVRRVVDGLTKLSKVDFRSAEASQAENIRRMVIAMTEDTRVILVKLADRLHNMRTLDHLRAEKRQRIATETLDIYAPIAGRLGIGKIEAELQDLSLRHLEPQTYGVLEARVKAKRRWSDDFIRDVSRALRRELSAESIPGDLSGRTKSIYSIHQKMRRQKIELDQMYDFIALRLVTDTVPHCYTALGVIHNTWRPIPGRIKDFIAMPRENGYQSLHTSLMTDSGTHFEVQIRTRDMHRVAEEGIAAHWSYKSGGRVAAEDMERFAWLRQVLEWQKELKDPNEFLSSLKIDLYPDEVHCFTPRGEVKTLPRGATAIDFAYAIHTEVGHTCVGARVNGVMTPLRQPLRNGDICEILTRKNRLPSEDWLKFARTNRAKSKIRARLNAEARKQAIVIGRKLVEKEARSHGFSLRRLRGAPGLPNALKRQGASTLDELYAAVGYGKAPPARVVADALPDEKLKRSPTPPRERGLAGAVRRIIGRPSGHILVSGHSDIMVHRARCCSPLPGEEIAGYITRGKGVSVHAARCPQLTDLGREPDRRVEVSWGSSGGARYDAGFIVRVENRKGILADLTKVIAETDTDIRSLDGAADDADRGNIRITVLVQNAKEIGAISRLLQGIPGVIEVHRASPRPEDPAAGS